MRVYARVRTCSFFSAAALLIIYRCFSCVIDCGLVAHRTCTATGLSSNCMPVDSENRAHRFTPGKWRCTRGAWSRVRSMRHAYSAR